MMPKYIKEIVQNNIIELPEPYGYRLQVNKHVSRDSLNTKLEKLKKWANRLCPDSVEIIKDSRIIGIHKTIDIKIYDPACREIEDIKALK